MYTLFTQAKTFFIHTDLPQHSTTSLHKNTILQDRSLSFISSLSHDSSLSNLNKNPQPHSDTTLKIISILHMDSLVTSILSMAVKHGPCLLTLKKKSRLSSQMPKETWTLLADTEKRIQAFKPSAQGNCSASPAWNTRPMTGCEARSTFLWVQRNLF